MNSRTLTYYGFIAIATLLHSCAFLHSTQIGEIDGRIISTGRKFELLVSETGININEAGAIARGINRNARTDSRLASLEAIISLFQMGPRTGNGVLDQTYADKIFDALKEKCPSGNMSGLVSIRESAKYPVISGEIVRIIGYCKDLKS